MKSINIIIIIIILFSILSSSCDDHSHSHSEHFAPEGWLFIDGSGSRFIQIFQGKFKSGSLTEFLVPLDGNTDHLKIKFLDKNEKEIEPPKIFRVYYKLGNFRQKHCGCGTTRQPGVGVSSERTERRHHHNSVSRDAWRSF